jgi:hypothetical protein
MNISSDALITIKRQQGQPPPGIRPYAPPMRQNVSVYGIQQIQKYLPTTSLALTQLPQRDQLRPGTTPARFPFGLSAAQVQTYLRTIYPEWNAARLAGKQREADWNKREWIIDGRRYTLAP